MASSTISFSCGNYMTLKCYSLFLLLPLFPSFFSSLFFYLLVQHSLTFSIVGIKDFSNTNLNTKHISCKRWVVWI